MAARKLQSEIDRTLKRVSEGVEVFENIYDKMQASTNQTQKEKLELDLKTQIKKLQRMRDQIKTWVANNDVKDKSQLLENRRLIETQMEKFKACEKEMKTKAFSKEGLIQAAKLDPKEQEKEEVTQWLQSSVEELQMQVEQTEAEVESLQGAVKKRGKAGTSASERATELEALNERRRFHIGRLEIILRLLNNGSLSTDKILALKDDVSYYVESNTEEDFEEDSYIYDTLNLEQEEEKFGLTFDDNNNDTDNSDVVSEDMPPRATKKHDEESVASSKRDESPVMKKATPAFQPRKPHVVSEPKPPPNPNFAQQTMSSVLKSGLPAQTTPKPPPMPAIKYAVAAAAAVAPISSPQGNPSHSINTPSTLVPATPLAISNPPSVAPLLPPIAPTGFPTTIQDHNPGALSSPSSTHPSATSPMLSSASLSQQLEEPFYSGQDSPALSDAVQSSLGGPAATSSPQRIASRKDSVSSMSRPATQVQSVIVLPSEAPSAQTIVQPSQAGVQLSALSPLPQQVQQHTSTALPGVPPTNGMVPIAPPSLQQSHPQFPPGVKVSTLPTSDQTNVTNTAVQQQATVAQRPTSATATQQPPPVSRSMAAGFPGSLTDLVMSFENVKQKAAHRMTNLDGVHKMLESGYSNVPQPQDTEKPKYYAPKNPYQTPSYYPQTPISVLSTPGIFSQLDVETLFYVFYYLPGTYQQYLAAKELKRQSWRFHVKYLTWFQRHSEPQAITEEYEQGVYVYFDWEGSWCQRKKSDFRFEYRYLSED